MAQITPKLITRAGMGVLAVMAVLCFGFPCTAINIGYALQETLEGVRSFVAHLCTTIGHTLWKWQWDFGIWWHAKAFACVGHDPELAKLVFDKDGKYLDYRKMDPINPDLKAAEEALDPIFSGWIIAGMLVTMGTLICGCFADEDERRRKARAARTQ